MKITNIAKAILLPALMLPIAATKANNNRGEYKEDIVIPAEKILFPKIDTTSAAVLALPRNIDPMSLALFELSRKFDRKNYINEIVVDKNRFPEDGKQTFDAYYGIDTENEGRFYIARYNEGRTENIFTAAYDEDEKKKGMLFIDFPNTSNPVTTVDAKEIGLNGYFEINELSGRYEIKYKFSPLLFTPNHTKVSSTFMLNIERELQTFPKKLINELHKNGIRVMIAANIEDAYYHYYPSWKQYDDNLFVDPKRPAVEWTENGFRDNRKYSNTGGFFVDRKVVIPQKYYTYGTEKVFDYSTSNEYTKRVLYHELGHAIDYVYNSAFSDDKDFKTAHNADTKPFTKQDIKDLAYFYRSRSETFAHVTAALLGGLSKSEASQMLSKFPMCAEHIRQNVLPRFDIELTKEQIRKDIYPNYLRKAGEKQTRLNITSDAISMVIIPPDMPQEIIAASLKKEVL